jgi:hypothetical protein
LGGIDGGGAGEISICYISGRGGEIILLVLLTAVLFIALRKNEGYFKEEIIFAKKGLFLNMTTYLYKIWIDSTSGIARHYGTSK